MSASDEAPPVSLSTRMSNLLAAAELPHASYLAPLDGLGMDNKLMLARLEDDRQVLLRVSADVVDPTVRNSFLTALQVGVPAQLASDGAGAVIVEFIPGITLAEKLLSGPVSDAVWHSVGAAHRKLHAVQFPFPLCGPFEPDHLKLAPVDPVKDLLSALTAAEDWALEHLGIQRPLLDRLRNLIVEISPTINAELPCLTHMDTNYYNIIVDNDQATLIDWDFPCVRFPSEELAGLEDHAQLYGLDGLPPSFFTGYGKKVPRQLILVRRVVGCLGILSSPDWAALLSGAVPLGEPQRQMLRRFVSGWREWLSDLDGLIDEIEGLHRASMA